MNHVNSPDNKAFDRPTSKTQMISTDRIYPSPMRGKHSLSKQELSTLIRSVQSQSAPPLTVTPISAQSESFLLQSGEELFQAYLYAKRIEIPCIVLPRKNSNVPKNYFEEADEIYAVYTVEEISEKELARRFQISPEACQRKMLLHEFEPTERKIILRAKISEQYAIKLFHLTPKEKYETYQAMLSGVVGLDAEDMILRFSERKSRVFIKHIGFFYNSIEKAIATMRQSGIDIQYSREEEERGTRLTIVIPNERQDQSS